MERSRTDVQDTLDYWMTQAEALELCREIQDFFKRGVVSVIVVQDDDGRYWIDALHMPKAESMLIANRDMWDMIK